MLEIVEVFLEMPVMFMSHAFPPPLHFEFVFSFGGRWGEGEFWKVKIIFKTECEKLPFH